MRKLFDAYEGRYEHMCSNMIAVHALLYFYEVMVKLPNVYFYRFQIWHVTICKLIFLAEKQNFWPEFPKVVSNFSPAILIDQ